MSIFDVALIKLQIGLLYVITVVSGRKAIVGLGHPVTIGIHISTEISKTSHPRDLKF